LEVKIDELNAENQNSEATEVKVDFGIVQKAKSKLADLNARSEAIIDKIDFVRIAIEHFWRELNFI
jgi:hypothetical protein